MKIISYYLYLLGLVVAMSPSGSAADVGEPETLVIPLLPVNVHRTLGQAHATSPQGPKSFLAIEKLATVILEDNEIDESERVLLDALIAGEPEYLQISPRQNEQAQLGGFAFFNKIDPQSVPVLQALAPATGEWADLEAIWRQAGRKNPFPDLLELQATSGQNHDRVIHFSAIHLTNLWQSSSMATGYVPFRPAITQLAHYSAQLPEPDRTKSRQLVDDVIDYMNERLLGEHRITEALIGNWRQVDPNTERRR